MLVAPRSPAPAASALGALGAAALLLFIGAGAPPALFSRPAVRLPPPEFPLPIILDAPEPLFPNQTHYALLINDHLLRGRGPIISTPMIIDLTGLHIDKFHTSQPCDVLIKTVRALGMNGAAMRIQVNNYHELGHVFFRVARERNLSLEPVMRAATRMSRGATTFNPGPYDTPTASSLGFMHGVAVAWLDDLVAQKRYAMKEDFKNWKFDWSWFLLEACDALDDSNFFMTYLCIHGLGHVFHYSQLRSMYPAPELNPEYCIPSPSPQEMGTWHGVFEWSLVSRDGEPISDPLLVRELNPDGSDSGRPSMDPFYPCTEPKVTQPNACFEAAFAFLYFGDWRILNTTRSAGKLTRICDHLPLFRQQLGCIYGMSTHFYPVYDTLALARSPEDLHQRPTMKWRSWLNAYDISEGWGGAASSYSNISQYPPPLANMYLLFGMDLETGGLTLERTIPETHVRDTLTAWCENFITDETKSGHEFGMSEWNRWRVCVLGSLFWTAQFVFLAQHETAHSSRIRKCLGFKDVLWLNETMAKASQELCEMAADPQPLAVEGVATEDLSHPLDEIFLLFRPQA